MNRKLAIASATLALGMGVSIANAAPGANGATLAGSDTLFDVTQNLLMVCPNANTLTYIGGGSGNGETAMLSPGTTNQYIAPMSRFLKVGATTCPATAQGYNVGLDGISIVRDKNSTVGCNTAAYTSSMTYSGGTYTFQDFRDVLRIVYGGFDHVAAPYSVAPCFTGEPSRSAIGTQNCNSAIRQAVVNNWGNLFQNTACGAGETCTQLKHAFRRGDASGTTDTFLTILAMPKIASNVKPFCNGADQEDLDLIRRSCTGNGGNTNGEQVCQPREATAMAYPADNTIALGPPSTPWEPAVANTGDLGLVLDINVPEGVSTTISHKTTACNFGAFDLVHMPSAFQLAGTRCPNGTPQVLLKCSYPKDAAGNYGCLNTAVNVPPIGELKKIDGRVYNLILRTGNDPDNDIVKDKNNKLMTGAYYRLHETKVMPGSGGVPCTYADSTQQIGCLVQASPCSIGFAGREAADDPTVGNNDVLALALGTPDNSTAIQPSDSSIQQLLVNDPTCTGGQLSTRYGLARRLWLNSILGFSNANIPLDQVALASCFADRGYTDHALRINGFTLLPQPTSGLPSGITTCEAAGPGVAACMLSPISQPCL